MLARRRNLLEELSREITTAGAPAPEIIEADVMLEGAAEAIAAEARRRLGPVDSYITGTVMPVDGGLRRFAF